MSCPTCDYALQKLSVTTNAGGKFDVDHCGRCGGTWFDPYEINRIPYHEVVRLAHVTVIPKTKQEKKGTLLCPRCHKKLERSVGESVPSGVSILRCGKCHGVWATQRALADFKKHQEQTVAEYKAGQTAFPSLSVVFMPALFLLLLTLSTLLTVTHLQEAREGRIRAEEIITSLQIIPLSPTTVSITFESKSLVRSKVTYGTSSLELTSLDVSTAPSNKHGIVLKNLTPNTYYLYNLVLIDETGRSFTTSQKSFITNKD